MPRVSLSTLEQAHAKAMVRWLRDPYMTRNLGLRHVPTSRKAREFIEYAATDATICARAILVDGEHVGVVELDRIDRQLSKVRLRIYIGPKEARGQGYGRRALTLALDLAFKDLDVHKVWLTVHSRNTPAIAAFTAVGFQIEGIHRDEFLLGRERVGEIYMGLLASEWMQ